MRHPLLVATLLLGFAGVARAMPPTEVFAKVSPSVVVVEGLDVDDRPTGQGSGVVVRTGVVATNCHVLKDADAYKVRHRGRTFAAQLRDVDYDRDLCSLDVRGLAAPAVVTGSSRLRVGARVFTVGAPQGLELTLGDGIVSSLRGDEQYKLIQITAPISPGSSGGGLFDESGRLVGITTMYLKDSQSLNFAVPVEWIAEMPARSQKAFAAWLAGKAAADGARAANGEDEEDGYDAVQEGIDAAVAAAEEEDENVRRAADAAAAAADAAAAAAARAYSRWLEVFDNEFLREMDIETVQRVGTRVKVWLRDTYAVPKTVSGFKNVKYSKNRFEYDCANRSFRILDYGLYDSRENPLWTSSTPYASFAPVVPESLGETTFKLACSWG